MSAGEESFDRAYLRGRSIIAATAGILATPEQRPVAPGDFFGQKDILPESTPVRRRGFSANLQPNQPYLDLAPITVDQRE